MKRDVTIALTMLALFALTPLPGAAQHTSSLFGLYAYPAKGQSESEQVNDESICYKSAVSRTGVDPANLPPAPAPQPTQHQGGAVRGAARGAAAGALIGAVAGNAGQGAAIGATAGGIGGYAGQRRLNEAEKHYAQANAQAQQSQQIGKFKRAYSACLESKGYTVK
jgi:hypothetical protein